MQAAKRPRPKFYLSHHAAEMIWATLLGVAILFPVKSRSLANQTGQSKDARMQAAKQLIGGDVFACQTAQFYEFRPNSTFGIPIGNRVPYFPLLTPFKIVGVLPSVSSELVQGLLIVVETPKQKKMVFKTHLQLTGPLLQGKKLLEQLVSGDFGVMMAVPKSFSQDEVESIQYHLVTRGMSEDEVICALGIPESTNDYGQGGQQLVYMGGRELIYIDPDTYKVTDVQHFGN